MGRPRAHAGGKSLVNSPFTCVDLHMHTTFSDGLLDPEALLQVAAGNGVQLCAITDHDSVSGLPRATLAASNLGIQLITGVELSTTWHGRTLHVLGLGIDPGAASLTRLLSRLHELRRARALAIAARLDKHGMPGSVILDSLSQCPVITRTHFARELVSRGHAKDTASAFSRWLAKGQPANASAEWPELADTLRAILGAGGAPVLAHPLRYTLSAGQRRTMVKEFAQGGGQALEVVVGGQSPSQTQTAVGLCLRADLEGSQGSDCHDPALPWQRPGRLAKLPPAVTPIWHRWVDLHDSPARPTRTAE